MTKYLILTACLLLLIAQETKAQNWQILPSVHHSSTAAEGYLRGRAALRAGSGRFLEGLGRYELYHQDAISRSFDNELKRAQTYWLKKEMREEYKKRPTYLERMERSLDLAEQRHTLKQREQELIAKGVLPKKRESGFYYDGKFYKGWSDFENSKGHLIMKLRVSAKAAERKRQEQLAEARRQEYNNFLQMRHKMSWLEQKRYQNLSPVEQDEYRKERYNPEYFNFKMKLHDSAEFYERSPYLLPSAGKNGLPKSPRSLIEEHIHLIEKFQGVE